MSKLCVISMINGPAALRRIRVSHEDATKIPLGGGGEIQLCIVEIVQGPSKTKKEATGIIMPEARDRPHVEKSVKEPTSPRPFAPITKGRDVPRAGIHA